jgi:hypothetical protein
MTYPEGLPPSCPWPRTLVYKPSQPGWAHPCVPSLIFSRRISNFERGVKWFPRLEYSAKDCTWPLVTGKSITHAHAVGLPVTQGCRPHLTWHSNHPVSVISFYLSRSLRTCYEEGIPCGISCGHTSTWAVACWHVTRTLKFMKKAPPQALIGGVAPLLE